MWHQILSFRLFAGSQKKSLFRVISQKIDTIGYATVIAPVISSKIKPRMFISLLCVHVGIHCAENPHYYTRDCCNCSVHKSSSSEALAAIKGGQEALPEAPILWRYGSQLVFSFRKLSPSWNLCSVFQQKMLEEYLWLAREVSAAMPCNPTALIGSILGIIPLHIPMREVLCAPVASSCVILLGFLRWKYPRIDISGEQA